jgi:hypothetical protein
MSSQVLKEAVSDSDTDPSSSDFVFDPASNPKANHIANIAGISLACFYGLVGLIIFTAWIIRAIRRWSRNCRTVDEESKEIVTHSKGLDAFISTSLQDNESKTKAAYDTESESSKTRMGDEEDIYSENHHEIRIGENSPTPLLALNDRSSYSHDPYSPALAAAARARARSSSLLIGSSSSNFSRPIGASPNSRGTTKVYKFSLTPSTKQDRRYNRERAKTQVPEDVEMQRVDGTRRRAAVTSTREAESMTISTEDIRIAQGQGVDYSPSIYADEWSGVPRI